MIDLELERPAWHADAACRGMDTSIFFPAPGDPMDAALAVCRRCPVATECRAAGMREDHGIWGSTSARERRRFRQEAWRRWRDGMGPRLGVAVSGGRVEAVVP